MARATACAESSTRTCATSARRPRHNLELVAATPSSALGSTRDKPDEAYCREIFKVLKAHSITQFHYIGGNDSSDTVRIVSEQARSVGYPLRCIHIPKTIDNDLVLNDHTPGYPSAARFVAQAFAGANLDNASLPGVYVAVVMGRHAGFLTAASALARKYPDDGPHLIYLPERAFDMDRFLADVKAVHERLGRCVIAVSEGVHDAAGKLIASDDGKDVERDAHGNVQLSGSGALAEAALRRHQGAPRHQAGARRHLRLPAALLLRLRVGCRPARGARGRREGGAVRDVGRGRRLGHHPAHRLLCASTTQLAPLEGIAGKTRLMDESFIAAVRRPTSPRHSTPTCARCSAPACRMPAACARRWWPRRSAGT